jgi:hypothetical protein
MSIHALRNSTILGLLAVTAGSDPSFAETFRLEPGPASRIQELIDDVVVDGDEIILEVGDHSVGTVIDLKGRAITLRGEVDRFGRPVARLVGAGGTGILSCRSGETGETRIETLEVVDGDIDLGAGLLIVDSSPSLFGVRFIGNTASVFGGGVCIFGSASDPRFEACDFIDNRADLVGGGCLNGTNASPIYRDCFWSGNSAGLYGRGMYNQVDATPSLVGCEVDGCCDVVPPGSFIDEGENLIDPYCGGCRADFNCYGGVGSADLGLLLGAWGSTDPVYDLDGDGVVGGSDIGALVAQWGDCS